MESRKNVTICVALLLLTIVLIRRVKIREDYIKKIEEFRSTEPLKTTTSVEQSISSPTSTTDANQASSLSVTKILATKTTKLDTENPVHSTEANQASTSTNEMATTTSQSLTTTQRLEIKIQFLA